MAMTMTKKSYKFTLINEETNEAVKSAKTLETIKNFLIASLYPSGTKFRVERKTYVNGYLDSSFMNYKQFVIA